MERFNKTVPPLKAPADVSDKDFIDNEQPEPGQFEDTVPDHLPSTSDIVHSMHTTVAVLFLGNVAFTTVLFYLVKFPDPAIRLATWRLLSTTISFFLGVLK